MVLLFLSWILRDDRAHQAIVRRKGQTPEAAATAGAQCETNHIFVALTALTWCRESQTGSRRAAIMTARSFFPRRAHALRSIVTITPNLQVVDAPSPRFDKAWSVS